MEAEHIYQNTARAVYLAHGSVELIDEKNPRKRQVATFENIMVAGNTDAERRENFSYAKAFPWECRKAIREKESKGLVRLIELNVGKRLGITKGSHLVPESRPSHLNDEII